MNKTITQQSNGCKMTAAGVLIGTRKDLMEVNGSKPSFSEQLYDVLENEEHHDILQWTPDGKAFYVVDQKKFTRHKMLKLFSIQNMSSFVRKLKRWGFNRILRPGVANRDLFEHPCFCKGGRQRVQKKVRCVGKLLAAEAMSSKDSVRKKSLKPAPFTGGNAYGGDTSGKKPPRSLQPKALRSTADSVVNATAPICLNLYSTRVPAPSLTKTEDLSLSHEKQYGMQVGYQDLQIRAVEIENRRRQLLLEQWKLQQDVHRGKTDKEAASLHSRKGMIPYRYPPPFVATAWASCQSNSYGPSNSTPPLMAGANFEAIPTNAGMLPPAHLVEMRMTEPTSVAHYPAVETSTAAMMFSSIAMVPNEVRSQRKAAVICALLEQAEQELNKSQLRQLYPST